MMRRLRAFDNPVQCDVRQPIGLQSAADVRVYAREPALLHLLVWMNFGPDFGSEVEALLVDGQRLPCVLDQLRRFAVRVETTGTSGRARTSGPKP